MSEFYGYQVIQSDTDTYAFLFSYQKIASNIASQLNPVSIDRVKSVMQWIGFSATPLRRMELLSAVTFSLGDSHVDQLVPPFFLQDCFSLLEERPDKTIGYIHATVKEYVHPDTIFCKISENIAND